MKYYQVSFRRIPGTAPWKKEFIHEYISMPFLKCLRNMDEGLLFLLYNLDTRGGKKPFSFKAKQLGSLVAN